MTIHYSDSGKLLYTPYEGLNLANQNNRKLEVFGRKLEETSQNCIGILIKLILVKVTQYYSIDVFYIDKIYLGVRNIAITLKLEPKKPH